jgi:dephospho-CoA kinase
VKRIVIAGGIGAGKSAATDYLATLGYPVIDADDVAHDVTRPGEPAFEALRDAFGDAVVAPDGTLDRAFVAEIVFHDESALKRLNLITHGHIGREITSRIEATTGPAVFISLPLFRSEHRATFRIDEAWAIVSEPEVALSRLVEHRGFLEQDARARLAAQMSNEERASIVDVVVRNDGSLEDLHLAIDRQLERSGLSHG